MQFVLCELLFLCYTTTDDNHGGICEFLSELFGKT